MLSVSFYLLNPKAISQSLVYVSISNKEHRLRFSTGVGFITSYCNIRKKKGTKELIKRNTTFYLEYNSILNEIRDTIIRIEMDLSKENKCSLEDVRNKYYLTTGKLKGEGNISFTESYNKFLSATSSSWSDGTKKHFITLQNHLLEYESKTEELLLKNINEDFWNKIRDDYFVGVKNFSNSTTNKNLKKFKQFIKFAIKKAFITHSINLEELKFLEEIEAFKIALKENEVETLLQLNLQVNIRLEKVRDLFALEILTGQRFSDMQKVLDKKHISETNIQIYQQKTGEKVTIPLHPRLKKHLAYIFNKYPNGLPTISNEKFNKYLKEVCIIAKFNREHSWITLSGKKKITHSDYRYNLITSHTGRRTFCTLARKVGIQHELIMKVSGHKSYSQFIAYVKVDDEDLDNAFEGMLESKIINAL